MATTALREALEAAGSQDPYIVYITSTLRALGADGNEALAAKECHQLMMYLSFSEIKSAVHDNIADKINEYCHEFFSRIIETIPESDRERANTSVNDCMTNCAQVMYRTHIKQLQGQMAQNTLESTIAELKRRYAEMVDELVARTK